MQAIGKLCGAVLLAGASMFTSAHAQEAAWPARAVRIVVPSSPGGGTDIAARLIAHQLTQGLGQSFVVDNRPGAGQALGTELVAHSAADGYTLLMGASAIVLNQVLSAKPTYDVTRDFAAVTRVAELANVLVVHPSLPVKTAQELIAYAKANPNALNYSSAGSGTSPHLSMELFRSMAGISMTHVPYKGTGPAVQDLLAGQVQLSMVNLLTGLPHIKAGKLRPLGTTGKKRAASLAAVPTIAEAGLPGYEANQWYGLLVPTGTPAAIVNRIQAQVGKALGQPEMQKRLEADGAEGVGDRPEEFTAYIRGELGKWGKVVKAAGITAD